MCKGSGDSLGWYLCACVTAGFTVTAGSGDWSFVVITGTLPFCEGEHGVLFGKGIEWQSSGKLSPTISTSSSTFLHLQFSVDLRGSTCHPCFMLFAACPTLPEYLLLRVARGKRCCRSFFFGWAFGAFLGGGFDEPSCSRIIPLDAFGDDFSIILTQFSRLFLTSTSISVSLTMKVRDFAWFMSSLHWAATVLLKQLGMGRFSLWTFRRLLVSPELAVKLSSLGSGRFSLSAMIRLSISSELLFILSSSGRFVPGSVLLMGKMRSWSSMKKGEVL